MGWWARRWLLLSNHHLGNPLQSLHCRNNGPNCWNMETKAGSPFLHCPWRHFLGVSNFLFACPTGHQTPSDQIWSRENRKSDVYLDQPFPMAVLTYTVHQSRGIRRDSHITLYTIRIEIWLDGGENENRFFKRRRDEVGTLNAYNIAKNHAWSAHQEQTNGFIKNTTRRRWPSSFIHSEELLMCFY